MSRLVKCSISIFFISIAVASLIAINNILIICTLAKGFDIPSKPYYMLLERAIKLTSRQANSDYLRASLKNGSNRHLHSMFMYLIGLEGDPKSARYLFDYCNDNCKNVGARDVIYSGINTMGLLGDVSFIPGLEKAREDYANDLYKKYLINKSTYLITGNNYYHESSGKQYFNIESSFRYYRRIISDSVGRKRTSDEMISLDRLSRPPGW